ncbi:hypothetical protein [Maridesulfovibrio sp.]|uniref:hypothetical protein n=1 Tax=Maridesulfovibrio sp. TaxID=2795000 RepID=UPI0029C9BAF4|nr:hypothetical protein [Maridesulfovibrio sp.]
MDLFYRLAVAILKLPPLCEREGDLSLLIDSLLNNVNEESSEEIGGEYKKISASAKKLLLQHSWPGNVRELLNTLRRMVVWSDSDVLTEADARESLIVQPVKNVETILDKPIDSGVNLPVIIAEVASHYLSRALDFTAGNKSKSAKILGLPNYQTLTNWMKKYGIEK